MYKLREINPYPESPHWREWRYGQGKNALWAVVRFDQEARLWRIINQPPPPLDLGVGWSHRSLDYLRRYWELNARPAWYHRDAVLNNHPDRIVLADLPPPPQDEAWARLQRIRSENKTANLDAAIKKSWT